MGDPTKWKKQISKDLQLTRPTSFSSQELKVKPRREKSTILPPDLILLKTLPAELSHFLNSRRELVLLPSLKISNLPRSTDLSDKLELIESTKVRESREQRMLRPPKSE